MSETVVMPKTDWVNALDAVRAKTGSTELITSGELAGKISGIDGAFVPEASIIDRTVTNVSHDTVLTVGDSAFSYCYDLVSVSFPNATTVGSSAFDGCNSLVSVNLPKATVLSGFAFRYCTRLVSLDLPCAESMGTDCCYGCTSLETIILRSETVCQIKSDTFSNGALITTGTGYAYVPAALVDAYKVAENWSTYASQIRAIEDYPDITGG